MHLGSYSKIKITLASRDAVKLKAMSERAADPESFRKPFQQGALCFCPASPKVGIAPEMPPNAAAPGTEGLRSLFGELLGFLFKLVHVAFVIGRY